MSKTASLFITLIILLGLVLVPCVKELSLDEKDNITEVSTPSLELLSKENGGKMPCEQKEGSSLGKSEILNDLSESEWYFIRDYIESTRYQISWDEFCSAFVAENPSNGLSLEFKEGETYVSPHDGDEWAWSLSPIKWGYEGHMCGITHTPSTTAEKTMIRNTYNERFIEWYINDERGLKHGFTITAPPKSSQHDVPLLIEMTMDTTLSGKVIERNQGVAFFDTDNHLVFSYDKLFVLR